MSVSGRLKALWPRKKATQSRRHNPTSAVTQIPAGQEPRKAVESGLGLPRFQTSAADHVDRGRADPLARERIRLRNSFTPTQPVVDPRMFAGRRDLLESLIRAVEDQRSHVVIFGDRGAGKTSLLRMLSRAANEAKYIVVYFSCGATSDFSETFRAVATDIPLLYHSAISPISSNPAVGTSLSDLLGPGKITPRVFGDAAAKLVGTRVLVVLDEFDRADSPEFRRDVAELIKTLSDVSARVQLVIAGVAADLIDLMEHIPSIRRSLAAIRVPAMSDVEVTDLIGNGSKMSGVSFDARATELVVSAARGSPYITNLICHVAGMRALEKGRLRVTFDDVANALEDVIDDFRRRLPAQLALHLDQVAKGVGPVATDLNGGDASKTDSRPGKAGNLSNISSRVLEKLKKEGAIEAANPAAYALMLDSVTPYLQLKSASEKFAADAA